MTSALNDVAKKIDAARFFILSRLQLGLFKLGLFTLGALTGSAVCASANGYVEQPYFAEKVASGMLPAIAERVPADPFVVDLAAKDRAVGAYGGTMHILGNKDKSIRYMVVNGYARLVGYNEAYELVPDLLRDVTVDEGKVFTFHLRAGHKWSDGAPFTTEDFRYWWEEVANNEELRPSGPPVFLQVEGEWPQVTILDETTIRYAWSKPNPLFLAELAGARPPFIYQPAHYMKQFHKNHVGEAALAPMIAAEGVRNWAALHNRMDEMYKYTNAALPTLQPWINTIDPPATRYVFERNPFYHRVDTAGHQLPYIDEVVMTIAAGGLIAAKANAGEVDLQSWGLSLSDAAILRKGEETGNYEARLWTTGYAADMALYPNLTVNDAGWRTLLRDKRFRHALSMGIDRRVINDVVYSGFAKAGNIGPLKESPLHHRKRARKFSKFDPKRADRLLDEIGLAWDAKRNFRMLPDGRPLQIVIETDGERPNEIDALQLIKESWAEIGIDVIMRPLDRDILRNRVYAGETMMAAFYGWDVGIPTVQMAPSFLAPVTQDNFSWPRWGQYHQTSGSAGEPVDMPAAKKLMDRYKAWMNAKSDQERHDIWSDMLDIHAEELFAIGLIQSAPQPIVVRNGLMNVPKRAVYSYEPGAQFGVYRPDEFFYAQ